MNPKMIEMKERIKLNAEYIKYSKLVNHKHVDAKHIEKFNELQSKLFTEQPSGYMRPNDLYIEYRRLFHIAYSLLKGRTYEQIENKVHEHNKLSKYQWKYINDLVSSICASECL